MTSGPLSDLRVVEAGRFITAPYASMLLADLGAEVIKVEAPGAGDPFRVGKPGQVSPRFLAYNRGKRALSLDLRAEQGRSVLLRLLERSDVFVHNFRPGTLSELGLGYDDVAALCPQLVYCSISGAGEDGPLARAPMYDAIGQALTGLMSQLSPLDDPQPIGPALSDAITGLTAAYGIQAAVHERHRTGRGQHVRTSMLEATISFLAEPVSHYFVTGEEPDPMTRPRQSQSYGFLPSDGRPFVVHMSSPEKFWVGLVTVADRLDLLEDPRFMTYNDRVDRYPEVQAELDPVFSKQPRDHWLSLLAAHDVPAAPVLGLADVFEHEHIAGLGMAAELEGEAYRDVRVAGRGVRVDGLAPLVGPPQPSQDTDAVLEDLGYDTAEVAQMRAAGAIS